MPAARNAPAALIAAPATLMAIALLCLPVSAPRADTAGNPAVGHRLAAIWCSTCHVVDRTAQRATSTGAPPFAAIAAMPSVTRRALESFLQVPHGRMPDLHLTRQEIADLAAYILRLRRPPPDRS